MSLDLGSSGVTRSVVAAFSDSPALRETLAILLERDCAVEFLAASTAMGPDWMPPDVAVVATPMPVALLHTLATRWPQLPIVAIELSGHEQLSTTPGVPAGVRTVALEPQAIRAAVLEQLVAPSDAALRATARRIVEALRGELHYSFSALRSLTTLRARGAGPEVYSILGTVISEQCHVLADSFEHLQAFLARPSSGEVSVGFVETLCRHLERGDGSDDVRGILCERSDSLAILPPAGPMTLAPLIAAFMRAHVRRRADLPVVRLSVSAHGLRLTYVPRSFAAATSPSWPLLLAALALHERGWDLQVSRTATDELIDLRPATPGNP